MSDLRGGFFGTTRLVECYKVTPEGLMMGGYRIDYDEYGTEIRRTEPTYSGTICCDGESGDDIAKRFGLKLAAIEKRP